MFSPYVSVHLGPLSNNWRPKARSVHDFYRNDLNLSMKKVKVSMVTNVDYREPVLNQAARIRSHKLVCPDSFTFKFALGITLLICYAVSSAHGIGNWRPSWVAELFG